MSQYHYYSLYGLSLASEIPLPELPVTQPITDVLIRNCCLQQIPIPEQYRHKNFRLNEQQHLIDVKGVARYLVTKGREIQVDANPGASQQQIRVFLLGSAMGALLHQRGFLLIHGNAIEVNGKCLIFAGHKGQGKSTLAAAFAQAGYRVLSDDLCIINFAENGQPMVQPGQPHIKLWRDSLTHIGSLPENYKMVIPGEEKYLVPALSSHCPEPLPLTTIFALRFHQKPGFTFQNLDHLEAMIALKNYTYRSEMAQRIHLPHVHFQIFTKLLKSVTLTRLYRPRGLALLDHLVKEIDQVTATSAHALNTNGTGI
jgi:hypothetical protein